MYLKKLEIAGFKSFAKQSVLEFNTPISAIVGPNGSGKSNIAEAFRFVLGEQSIKSLRGKKGEDLIFNGSHESGRANRASVKVTFDNSKRFLNLDFDEVSIERVVHRDSVNEYAINGSQVRLRDILELLASAHIGSSGHHIISQGEADKILNANLKERKAMIEDALGLKIYQYKRQESERKLDKTLENIKSVESLRREIVPHLKFLKKQVEKVEKAREMKEELKALYRDYFKRESEYVKWARKNLEEKKHPLQELLKRLEAQLVEAKAVLSQSASKDEKSTEVISLEEKRRNVRNEKDGLMRDIGRIEGEIAAAQRILKRQKELADSNAHKTVYLRDVESLAGEVGAKITEGENSSDFVVLKTILKNIRDLFADFINKNRNETDDSVIREEEAEIAKLTGDKEVLAQKIHKLGNVEQALYFEYEALKADIEKAKDSSRDAEKQVFKVVAEQNEVIARLNEIKGEEDRLKIEEENLKRELGEAGALVGRDVLAYETYVPVNKEGQMLSLEQIVTEQRHLQGERARAIEKIKIRLEDSGGGSSEEIMKEFKEVSDRDEFLARELLDLDKSAGSLRVMITELEEKINTEFKAGVEKINKQFHEFFGLMFGGGQASLSVVREKRKKRADTDLGDLLTENPEAMNEVEEEAEEGVDIQVSLPRKKIKGLVMLSGGERALTSIALLFAVSQVNPPPFIILDETDAALDEANSKKYGDMITNLSKYSQLILITHNRETMSRAGILYGVTMGSGGISKLLSIAFEEAVVVAK